MARAIWTGTINFGLVSIPVGLYSATQDHTIHFHQYERDTSDRIRNQRVNERTGDQVGYGDIVKGAEVGEGQHVVIEPDELDAIAPGRSRSIDISEFVTLEEINPIYFNRTYWLAPTDGDNTHPYALLLEAMSRTGRAAIGSFVMRGKEYLAAVRADGNLLALETLFFADEIRDATRELDNLPETGQAKPKELKMATRLIESMSDSWQPDRHHDSYRDRVAQLIEDKQQGNEVDEEASAPQGTAMSDLLEALTRSVEGAKSRDTRGESGRGARGSQRRAEPELAKLTKAQLTELARERDISGRSRMTRDQLLAALTNTATTRQAS